MATRTLTTSNNDTVAFISGKNTVNGMLGTGATLNSGDRLSGGSGTDTLNISGAGAFDLNSLATFTGFEVVTLNGTGESLTLKNGQNLTVTAGSDNTVTLGTGSDKVSFTDGTNTVNATSATLNSGDKLTGGSDTTDALNISGAGSFDLTSLATFTGFEFVNLTGSGESLTLRKGQNLTVDAGSGNAVTLGTGNDTVAFTSGTNTMNATIGTGATLNNNDKLTGGSAADTLNISGTGAFNLNSLATFTGFEVVNLTGSGESLTLKNGQNLTVNAGSGNTVTLGTGTDTVGFINGTNTVYATSATLNNTDKLTGGTGTDTLSISGAGAFNLNNLATFTGFEFVNLTGSGETLTLTNGQNLTVNAGGSGNTVALGTGTVTLGAGTETVSFTDGTNTVNATSATLNSGDKLTGGTGTDTLSISGAGTFDLNSLTTFTGFESVNLNGSGESLTLANGQNLTVNAGSGNTVTLGSGTDTVAFTSGTNTVKAKSATLNSTDSLSGGSGTDTLNISGAGAFNLNSLATFTGFESVNLTNNGESLTLKNGQNLTVNAGSGNTVTLGSGTDTVAFTSGTNTVNATSATLNNTDKLTGGTGTDTLSISGAGAFNLNNLATFTGFEFVNLNGSGETLTLKNGQNLTVKAGSGNTVTLGAGTDTVGFINGTNTVNATSATLNNTDKLTGGTGTDTLSISGAGAFNLNSLAAFTGFESVNLTNNGESLTLKNGQNLTVNAGSGNTVTLGSGTDTVAFTSGTNTVNATSATLNNTDKLTGGTGTDTLSISGAGAFNLNNLATFTGFEFVNLTGSGETLTLTNGQNLTVNAGGSGNTVALGTGTVTLGAGTETVSFTDGTNTVNATSATLNNTDKLTGGTGTDTLSISGAGTFDLNSLATFTGFEVVNLDDTGQSVTLKNGRDMIVHSYGGDDTLTGGTGADTIDGGADSDTAIYSGNRADYAIGGAPSAMTITDSVAGRDGADTVNNVEFVRFADGTFAAADLFNAAPTISSNPTVSLDEDTDRVLTPEDFNFADSDAGDHLEAVRFDSLPTSGQLWWDANGGSSSDAVLATIGQVIARAEIDAGHVFFRPTPNANGTGYATLTYSVSDGEAFSASATMTIDVTPINDAPVTGDASVATLEDAAYSFTLADFPFSDSNDDPAHSLADVIVTSLPGSGTLSYNGTPISSAQAASGLVISSADIAAGKLTYAPPTNANGTGLGSFTFRVQDTGVAGTAASATWTFNGSAADSSGHGHNLALTGGAMFAAGLSGQALSLDGAKASGASLSADPAAFDLGSDDFTIQVWAKFDDLSRESTLIEKWTDDSGPGWTFTTIDDHRLQFYASAVTVLTTSALAIATGEWHQFVAERSDSTFKIFMDGALVGTATGTGAIAPSASPLLIGGRNAGDPRNFTVDGEIDNVVIVDHAWTSAEVASNWNGGLGVVYDETISDPATMTIDVTPINDAPVTGDASVATLEDAAYSFTLADFPFSDSNDDPAHSLADVIVTSLPGSGTLSYNGTPISSAQAASGLVISSADIAAGKLTYAPPTNANGTGLGSFTFRVQDTGVAGTAASATWTFNGSAADSSGHGHNLALTGGAMFAAGLSGQALSLDGAKASGASLSADPAAFDLGSDDFTIQVWAKFDDLSRESTLIEKWTDDSGPGWTFTTIDDHRLQFYASAVTVLTTSALAIATGEWHQFVAERSDSTFKIFMDGALVGTATGTGAIAPSASPLLIGGRNAGDPRNFTVDGEIDNVVIVDHAWTSAEVASNWNGGLGVVYDETISDPATMTIDVTPINDAPVVTAAVLATVNEDAPNPASINLLANASDPDLTDIDVANVTYAVTAGTWAPPVAYSVDAETGALTFDPNQFNALGASENVALTFSYTVVDGNGGVTPTTAVVSITGGNPDIDVFVANNGGPNQVLLNDSNGAFTAAPTQPPAPNFSADVALGDLDGDGDLDAFVSNNGQPNQVLLNQGGAQGGTPGNLDLGIDPEGGSHTKFSGHSVALGDLDGDGDLDAFVANYGSANQVLINQGGAQSGAPGDFDLGPEQPEGGSPPSFAVALGDLDGDGDLDAFVANANLPNQVLINQGGAQSGTPGDFNLGIAPEGGSQLSVSAALGDLDGDGDLDAFVANHTSPSQVLINQGGAQGGTPGDLDLGPEQPEGGSPSSADVALGDLDSDGDLDAFVANQGTPSQVLINQGGAQGGTPGDLDLGPEQPEGGSPLSISVALGDLDGDGDLDAFVANGNVGAPEPNQVLINQGGAQSGTPGDLNLGLDPEGGSQSSFGVALGDLDGDGTAPAVDENGLPNINQDGLLPGLYVDTVV